MRQGSKWEKERLQYDEIDRLNAEEMREKKRKAEIEEADYAEANRNRGLDLLRYRINEHISFNSGDIYLFYFHHHSYLLFVYYRRIKNRDYPECEFELKWFLDDERDRMLNRRKPRRIVQK